jgi:hypothetical protein
MDRRRQHRHGNRIAHQAVDIKEKQERQLYELQKA